VANWVDELVSQGILNCRLRAKSATGRGNAAAEYSLAPEWGGHGFGSPQDGANQGAASVCKQTDPIQGH
jgi:hypothetical protein